MGRNRKMQNVPTLTHQLTWGAGSRIPTVGLWARLVRVGLGEALGPRGRDVPVTAKAGASAVGGPHPYTDSHVGEGGGAQASQRNTVTFSPEILSGVWRNGVVSLLKLPGT